MTLFIRGGESTKIQKKGQENQLQNTRRMHWYTLEKIKTFSD